MASKPTSSVAAQIRRIVRRPPAGETDGWHPSVAEAFTLLRYLPDDRHIPEFSAIAIRAHRAIIAQIRRDITDIAWVDPTLAALAALLFTYLDGLYMFHNGEWQNTAVEVALTLLLDPPIDPGGPWRPDRDDNLPDLPGDEWKQGGK